jgi:hypothetical protein
MALPVLPYTGADGHYLNVSICINEDGGVNETAPCTRFEKLCVTDTNETADKIFWRYFDAAEFTNHVKGGRHEPQTTCTLLRYTSHKRVADT